MAKTEKVSEEKALAGAMSPDPRELTKEKSSESKGAKSESPTRHCDPLCQLTHLYSGHPVSAIAPAKKAAGKNDTAGNSLTESTETVSVPTATLKAACAAMDDLKKASGAKS